MKATSSISCPKCDSVTAVMSNTDQPQESPGHIFCGICGEKKPSDISREGGTTTQNSENGAGPRESLSPGDYPLLDWPSRNSVIGSMLRSMEYDTGTDMAERGEIKGGGSHEHAFEYLARTETALALLPDLERRIKEIVPTVEMGHRIIDQMEGWEESIASKLESSLGSDERKAMKELGREALLRWNSEEIQD